MDRQHYYQLMQGEGELDYEVYLQTQRLLTCQKPYDEFCNRDELMFQIVHQVQELWMKLIGFTLLEIDDYLAQKHTNRVITLFGRVYQLQQQMINGLSILETMSPKEYQVIRLQLGNGSGQESPGFRSLLKMAPQLWKSYEQHYLKANGLSIEQVYDSAYCHDDTYVVAEALAEFDEQFRLFRFRHLLLIERSIGLGAKSLKGRSVGLLEKGVQHYFYPALWEIRNQMTDSWGGEYGVKRPSISDGES
ncbi:tryptophan 2,3-dioxygenase family protein [Zooshikella sp. RANM57]|uniref:tryptophan 2,3-dioxygenase family protein n=1 Tax=Zooshikella sp. RANM57 TaxID=3425863 RepID=UPI003D6F182B